MKNKLHLYCDIQCPYCKRDIKNLIRSVLVGYGEKSYECPFCKTKVKINPTYRAIKTILFTLVLVLLCVPTFILSDMIYPLIGGQIDRYSPGRSAFFVLILAAIGFLVEIPIHAVLNQKISWAADITTNESGEAQEKQP
ncbi:MAG: hypothetical protein R3Y06_01130 [Faecalibacterium sp.]